MKIRSRTRLARLILGLCVGGAGILGSRAAQGAKVDDDLAKEDIPELRFDFSMFGGYHWFNGEHSLGRNNDSPKEISPKNGIAFGGRLGLHFNRWVGIEVEAGAVPSGTRGATPDAVTGDLGTTKMWVFGYRGSVIVNLNDGYAFQPFLLAGYGGLTTLVDNTNIVPASTWGFLHAGLGFKIGFTPWTGIRFDGRVMAPWTVLSPTIPKGDRIDYHGPDFEVLGSFFVNFGEVEKMRIYQKEKVIEAPKRGDKDGDGILDDVDRCPTEPEDKDGFQDQDGCPDPDNDNDGIPDGLDKCPNEAEDKDGFQDEDGCPDPDNDGDGILDTLDKCPNQAEDKDGFQDEDGCPDPDNDGDGIPDTLDKCPNQPETFNKYKDDDGCPDEVPPEVKKFTGVIEGINFKTASAEILPGSFVLLDRAVKVLADFPDVNMEISGHTDSRGKPDYNRDLSQRRADSVKMYFTSRGIANSRLQSVGYGPTRPIADNKSANGRATNRRTEFRLIDSGDKPQ